MEEKKKKKDLKTRVEVTPDGKTELDYGKEDLNKEPVAKSLLSRWDLIKKNLDNNAAILDLSTLSDDEDEEQEQAPEEEQDGPVADGEEDESQDVVPEDEEQDDAEQEERPEWLPDHIDHDGEEPDLHSGMEQEDDQDDSNGEMDEEGEQELIDALKEMGHSDAEIAHIVHGHMTPPVDEAKRAKAAAEYAGIDHDKEAHEKEMQIRDQEAQIEAEHAKRMKDVEYQRAQKEAGETDLDLEHKRRLQDIEYQKAKAESAFNEAAIEAEHKKRMLDLEYETAKQQKAIELEYKKKELDIKVKHADELARQKHKDKMAITKEDGKHKMAEKKAAIAESKADKKKVKKSDDELDDLSKAMPWRFSRKANQLVHPEHGFIAVNKLPTGGYEVKHNGTTLGRYSPEHVKDAVMYHTNTISSSNMYDPNRQTMQRPPVMPKPAPPFEPPMQVPPTEISQPALDAVNEKYGKLYHPDLSGTVDYKKKVTDGG